VAIALLAQNQKNVEGAKGGKSVMIAIDVRRRRSGLAAAQRSHRDWISSTSWTSLVFTVKDVSTLMMNMRCYD
jgi:hypothetical protein